MCKQYERNKNKKAVMEKRDERNTNRQDGSRARRQVLNAKEERMKRKQATNHVRREERSTDTQRNICT